MNTALLGFLIIGGTGLLVCDGLYFIFRLLDTPAEEMAARNDQK